MFFIPSGGHHRTPKIHHPPTHVQLETGSLTAFLNPIIEVELEHDPSTLRPAAVAENQQRTEVQTKPHDTF